MRSCQTCPSIHHRVHKVNQRVRDRHKPSSNKPRLWAAKTAEFLKLIRPSTAGYTRFMSVMYLEKTEMSISPARGGKNSLVSFFFVFFKCFFFPPQSPFCACLKAPVLNLYRAISLVSMRQLQYEVILKH